MEQKIKQLETKVNQLLKRIRVLEKQQPKKKPKEKKRELSDFSYQMMNKY